MIVDDIAEQRTIASQFLRQLGYQVNAVENGEEAISYLTQHKVDLLVLDMIMEPGINGLDTYRQVLKLHPGQKAVIASGFSESEDVREVKRLGAGVYLKKPFTLENIGFAVKKVLNPDFTQTNQQLFNS